MTTYEQFSSVEVPRDLRFGVTFDLALEGHGIADRRVGVVDLPDEQRWDAQLHDVLPDDELRMATSLAERVLQQAGYLPCIGQLDESERQEALVVLASRCDVVRNLDFLPVVLPGDGGFGFSRHDAHELDGNALRAIDVVEFRDKRRRNFCLVSRVFRNYKQIYF